MAINSRRSSEALALKVVDRIYASSVGAHWGDALEAVCDFLGARAADLNFFDTASQQVVRFLPARIDEYVLRYLDEYNRDPLKSNPRAPLAMGLSAGEFFVDSDVWPQHQRRTMPFFSELMEPWGTRDSITAMVRKTPATSEHWVILATHYHRRAAADSQERQRLRWLMPHMDRACMIEGQLAAAGRAQTVLELALDHVKQPVFLVGIGGRLMHINQAADALLAQGADLRVDAQQRLRLENPQTDHALQAAWLACADPQVSQRPPMPLVIKRQDGSVLLLTVQPVPSEMRREAGLIAVLVASNPAVGTQDRTVLLEQIYGLTPAEARLANALRNGSTLRAYALSQQLQYETARTYLRSVFAKTGVHRQAELAQKLSQLD